MSSNLLMFSLLRYGLSATHLRRTLTSLAASSGMHALLLATLAVVVVKAHHAADHQPPHNANLVLPAGSGGNDGPAIDGSLENATAPQSSGRNSATGAPPTVASGRLLLPSAAHVEFDPSGLLPSAPERIEPLAVEHEMQLDAPAMGGPAAAKAGAGLGQGGAGGAGGMGSGSSFFGLEAAGNKVVFVVDISGSMSGRRFFRARNELRQSIESLRETQQFFVIFFNGEALPMPAEKLLPATRENVSQTVEWLKYVECGGGTNPLPGLLMALQLQPDSIYLLTDGKFDPQVVWEVAQAEPPVPIPIYTISFANRTAEKLLKSIAKETGGVYRFVR